MMDTMNWMYIWRESKLSDAMKTDSINYKREKLEYMFLNWKKLYQEF